MLRRFSKFLLTKTAHFPEITEYTPFDFFFVNRHVCIVCEKNILTTKGYRVEDIVLVTGWGTPS
jgi:hypothetical protein